MPQARLERCIRDLAALNALPSLCVARTPEEARNIILDALPTVLDCDLVVLRLPGTPAAEYGVRHGRAMTAAELAEVAMPAGPSGVFYLEAEIPIGNERGRLIAGRGAPFEADTDRVLVNTAANVVGTILASANVLEAARRKDDFLAMLGHELRNPLAPILTAVELLARNPSIARERAVIDRNTRHIARLVDDLLDISRVTRGHVELRREIVSLKTVLERAIELATPLITRNRHELHVASFDETLLEGDPVRLAQVFGNLLTNAAKFTSPGGRIGVHVERTDARVRVTVRDNGCGIARDQLQRIFEPFVQADRERDALRGGLGLGLAIVNNLVHRHGGSIGVESEGRGHGSAFTVELQVAVATAPAASRSESPPAVEAAGRRILVVDDNVDIAELLSEALRDEGFETTIAHDGQAALAAWRTFRPHIGVLDVGLPDLDGFELAKTLRAEHGPNAMLIAATGYGQPTDRLRATDAGFDCFLVKPVSVREILRAVEKQ